jgi:colanic acid/amylovoran biosynthesis glycosyltransferase
MSKPKKIIFKLREFPHLSETFIVAQIVSAINLGYEVEILVHKILETEPNLSSSLIAQYGLMDKVKLEDYKIPKNKFTRLYKWIVLLLKNSMDMGVIYKFHKEQSQFSLTWLYQWHFYKQLNEVVLFHVQYGTGAKPLDILKKIGFFKPKLIVTFHGHDAFFPINGFILQEGYYDNLFQYADLITANTPYLGDKLTEIGCPKSLLQLIPVGVDTDFFYSKKQMKLPSSILKLITVGRLDKVKGQLFAIEVVRQLINKGIDVELTIIGGGEEQSNLENLITKYSLEEKVFFLGKKSPVEIREALWCHDVYLLMAVPLPDGRRETQGLATLEAQSCGLPVVVFDSGGVKYTVDNGISGFVCPEHDVETVVDKIAILANKTDLLEQMGANAVIFVKENYSQSIIDKRWQNIYNTVINGE